jgi:hypothetical protein
MLFATEERAPVARYVEAVDSPLSPMEAFAYLAHVEHFGEWDPSVESARQAVGREPGPGAAYDLVVNAGRGKPLKLRYHVLLFESPRRLVIQATTRTMRSRDAVTVTPRGDGSTVRYDARLNFRGPLKIADNLLESTFARLARAAGKGLRRELGGDAET